MLNKEIILSTLIATATCSTDMNGANNVFSEYKNDINPTLMVDIPNEKINYKLSSVQQSFNENTTQKIVEEFDIIVNFARKILEAESEIDQEIQKVINENFWDML